MINFNNQVALAQIAAFLGIIALLVTVYFFGKFPDTYQKKHSSTRK